MTEQHVIEAATQTMARVWRWHAEAGTKGTPEEHCRRLARALADADLLASSQRGGIHSYICGGATRRKRASGEGALTSPEVRTQARPQVAKRVGYQISAGRPA